MYRYFFVLGVFFTSFVFAAKAQTTDTTLIKKPDTIKVKRPVKSPSGSFAPKIDPAKEKIYHPDSTHSPHKAVIRSLMIPGWGQVYNHKWWKTPFIYGGLGLLTSAVIYNQRYYNEYLILSRYRNTSPPKKGDPYYDEYQLYGQLNVPTSNIADARENSRRNRDLSILGILGVWGIQAVEAYIDAKFINAYTVDNNLSMRVTPSVINQPVFAQTANSTYIPGIKITFTF